MGISELLIIIPICVLSIPLLVMIIYNCVRAKGKNRKVVHIGNIVLILAFLGVPAAFSVPVSFEAGENNNIIVGMECERTDEGHYRLYEVLSSSPVPTYPTVAVPEERVANGSYFERDHSAVIILEKDAELDSGNKFIFAEGSEYVVSDSVIKVMPAYRDLRTKILCGVFAALFLFDLAELFVVLYSGAKRKKNEFFNDFDAGGRGE